MKNKLIFRVRVFFLVSLTALVVFYWFSGLGDYLTFEALKENRESLLHFVRAHYMSSVAVFIAVYISTAFFVPGAIAFTLIAGFLFGVVEAVIYINIAATTGAALAFLSSRYLIGHRIQAKFRGPLAGFNREIKHYGSNYLFALRLVPVMPFFLVNYLAGITTIPFGKFIFTTFIGMLPGSVIYSYAGGHLAMINNPDDLLSPEFIAAFGLLGLFALLPVILRWRNRKEKGPQEGDYN